MLSTVRLRCACGEAGVWPRGQPGRSCLQQADTSSAGPKCPSSRVLHGLGALAKPGAQRQTQEGVAGWPDFDPDFAEEPGLIEPYLSAIRARGSDHDELLNRGRTRLMTTNVETYSTGNGEEPR